MVTRRPLVVQDGFVAELPVGDTVAAGTSTTEVVAGSGLVGGGSVSSNPRVDFALAANPSGIIYVGDSLGIDGAAQVSADTALASGSAAAVLADSALASGNASLVTASAALASGNAALDLVPTLGGGGAGTVAEFTAASAVVSGYAVGFDDAGKVQSVAAEITDDNTNPMSFPSAAVVFESASSPYISATYDSSNNKVIIAYQDSANSFYGTAIVGTVSGTSISFGTAVVFESATSTYTSSTYDSTNNRVVIAYRYDGASFDYGTAIVGTVSGTSISFGTAVVFESANSLNISTAYDSTNDRVVIAYQDGGNSSYGTSIVADALLYYSYKPTVNSYPNVLGISQSTVASGSSCLVNLPGTLYNDPAAGLTTGAFYYANPTTSGVTTTSTKPTTWDGQVPWNYIGRAVTSSGLMLLKSI